jgi:hypothetical protein
MKKMKLVMVGNGMAGVRTLEELIKISPDLYEIAVFGAEPHANYNRILLSPVLAGEMTIKDIMLNDVDWYQENNIRLHLNKKVTKIAHSQGGRRHGRAVRPAAARHRFQPVHPAGDGQGFTWRHQLPRYCRH